MDENPRTTPKPELTSEAILRRVEDRAADPHDPPESEGTLLWRPRMPRRGGDPPPLGSERGRTLRELLGRAIAAPALAGVTVFIAAVVIAIIMQIAQHGSADATGRAAASSDAQTSASGWSTPSDGAIPEGAGSADSAGGGETSGTGSGSSSRTIFVHVVGEVASPGVFELDPSSRVSDAIEAAGGATETAVLSAVNLARTVVDGEQIIVPGPSEAATGPGAAEGSTGAAGPSGPVGATGSGTLISINSADAVALEQLPRVGPALAERIIAWREANGSFSSVDQLLEVSGIGEKTLNGFRDLVTL